MSRLHWWIKVRLLQPRSILLLDINETAATQVQIFFRIQVRLMTPTQMFTAGYKWGCGNSGGNLLLDTTDAAATQRNVYWLDTRVRGFCYSGRFLVRIQVKLQLLRSAPTLDSGANLADVSVGYRWAFCHSVGRLYRWVSISKVVLSSF
jgi:hypothetical protein